MSLKPYLFNVSNIETLKKTSSTVVDNVDSTGLHTRKNSTIQTFSGVTGIVAVMNNNFGSYNQIYLDQYIDAVAQGQVKAIKYDGSLLAHVGADGPTGANQIDMWVDKRPYMTIAHTDAGWDSAWHVGTAFTGVNWDGFIRALLNGWKLTTSDVDVANCVWTGIKSLTTQVGAAGYAYCKATIDAGFQQYRMIYELATAVTTQLNLKPALSCSLKQVALPYDVLFY